MAIHRASAHGFFYGLHAIKQRIGLRHASARVLDGKGSISNDPSLNRPEIWHPFIATNLAQTSASL
jgi:hypothetical protein